MTPRLQLHHLRDRDHRVAAPEYLAEDPAHLVPTTYAVAQHCSDLPTHGPLAADGVRLSEDALFVRVYVVNGKRPVFRRLPAPTSQALERLVHLAS